LDLQALRARASHPGAIVDYGDDDGVVGVESTGAGGGGRITRSSSSTSSSCSVAGRDSRTGRVLWRVNACASSAPEGGRGGSSRSRRGEDSLPVTRPWYHRRCRRCSFTPSTTRDPSGNGIRITARCSSTSWCRMTATNDDVRAHSSLRG
jgi:hypothetical protein